MLRRLSAFLLLWASVVLAVQSVAGIEDAARAHVRCALHGELLHMDDAAPGKASAASDSQHGAELRAATTADPHHGCALADAVLPGAPPLPHTPDLPTLRWVLAPAPARAPPFVAPHALAPIVRAPKTSPPVA